MSVEKLSTSPTSPLSPRRWPADAFAWQRSLLALVILLVAFGAGIVLDALTSVAMGVTQADAKAERLSWGIIAGQTVAYVFPVAVTLALLPWVGRRSLRAFGFRAPNAGEIGTALIGTVAMYAVAEGVAAVQFAITHTKPQEAAINLFSSAHDTTLATAFALLAVLLAPFVEELIFRGFVFNALLRYLPVGIAATLDGIIFGAFHLSATAFVPLACSGIVLAFVYYRSGSLIASVMTHALFNVIGLAMLASGHGD